MQMAALYELPCRGLASVHKGLSLGALRAAHQCCVVPHVTLSAWLLARGLTPAVAGHNPHHRPATSGCWHLCERSIVDIAIWWSGGCAAGAGSRRNGRRAIRRRLHDAGPRRPRRPHLLPVVRPCHEPLPCCSLALLRGLAVGLAMHPSRSQCMTFDCSSKADSRRR